MDNLLKVQKKKYLVTTFFLLFFLLLFILLILYMYSNVCSKINPKSVNINNLNLDIERVKDISWYISIPKINLNHGIIEEGTTDQVLSDSIGHFEGTDMFDGNVCLAAHNRGNKVNYFERIHELEQGDVIYYNCESGGKIYEVESKDIIDVYDFSCTEKIKDKNIITLITCVEDNPNKRLCVRGVERGI